MTDATGAVTDRYDYDAFGNLLSQIGTTPNDFRYAGEQNDASLGLYNLRARYYNIQTGRFLTLDRANGAATRPSTLHRYAFNENDPINRIDPTGNISLPELTLSLYIRVAVLVFPAVNYANSTTIRTLLNPAAIVSSAEELVASGQFDEVARLARQLAATATTTGPEAFYTGYDALLAAQADAQAFGFSILNNSYAGKLYDLVAEHLGSTSSILEQIGQDISYQFALRASGTAYIYLGNSPAGRSSLLYTVEIPTLLLNSNVTSYVVHFADGTVRTLSPALFELILEGGSF